jgi:hypothetical protein
MFLQNVGVHLHVHLVSTQRTNVNTFIAVGISDLKHIDMFVFVLYTILFISDFCYNCFHIMDVSSTFLFL